MKKKLGKGKNGLKSLLIKILVVILGILLMGVLTVLAINAYVILLEHGRVYDHAIDLPEDTSVDCVVVLGAGLQSDGSPSHMLEDRLKVAVEVFNRIDADYILMSGDRASRYYDEPAAMKIYAEELGVDPSKILIDNKGFSTYDSATRIKDEFGFDNVVIITQEYHLYRALYIADDCGIDAIGVSADLRSYRKQAIFSFRELFARVKDFVICI